MAARLHAHGPARFSAMPAAEKLALALTLMHLAYQVLLHLLRMPPAGCRRHIAAALREVWKSALCAAPVHTASARGAHGLTVPQALGWLGSRLESRIERARPEL
jgi:hypothetical protein